jgi:hypothetical protein
MSVPRFPSAVAGRTSGEKRGDPFEADDAVAGGILLALGAAGVGL